jgi:hypothetical protein
MAFFWAEEPSALRSPLKQSPLVVEPAPVEPAPGAAPLFSDAQADSARAPDRAMAPKALKRETDTSVIPLDGVFVVDGDASGQRCADRGSTANIGGQGDRSPICG